jgi:D-tyrosyl-tRNA(Tyr) deacylase
MIGLLQRVTEARVTVDGVVIGEIGHGLLVLVGVERGDNETAAERLLERLVTYRVFPDTTGRMNLSLIDISGGMMLVPQFTLAADTHKGTRPSFSSAAPPELGLALFDHLLRRARVRCPLVAHGRFGANMQVAATNDGPVTFWLQVAP